MKKSLLLAAILIVLGLILTVGALLVRFHAETLDTVQYQTNTHTVTEVFSKIVIDTGMADVVVMPTDEATASVVCHEREKEIHAVTVTDQVLLIELQDTRAWYDHISVFDFDAPKITVLLPRAAYDSLLITAGTSDVTVKDTTVGELTVSTTTGDVKIEDTVIAHKAVLTLDTGDVTARNTTVGELTVSTTTGDVALFEVLMAESLRVTCSTGDVTLEACDAKTLYIETSTGDVEGSLLTEKQFLATSGTGEVFVPSSTVGGTCEVKTSTGDIEFVIKIAGGA